MSLTKKQIVLAIAGVLATGVASATVSLDTGTTVVNFANEATVDAVNGTPIVNDNVGNIISVSKQLGFSIGDGTSKYVRWEFGGPLVGAALAVTDFTTNAAGTPTITISQGGQVGDDYVIIELAAVGADITQANTVTFRPDFGAGSGKMEVTSKSTATISYSLYETAVDAVNKTNVLVSASGTWFTWGAGYTGSCTDVQANRIDVTNRTAFTPVAANTNVFTATVDTVANTYKPTGALVVAETDYFTPGSTITVTGDFTAFNAGAVTINGNAMAVTPVTFDSATYTVAAADLNASAFTNAPLNVTPDGVTNMNAGGFGFSIVDDGDATYDVGTLDLGTCGQLLFSGSTDRIDFVLSPGGFYTQYVRVTNPSNTSGAVSMTVYNDAGNSVDIDLGAISGQSTSTVAAYASTSLININDVYAAAQAADATFDATGGKMRIQVRGEFGDDAVDGAAASVVGRRDDGVYIQGLTLSTDGTSFFQTK